MTALDAQSKHDLRRDRRAMRANRKVRRANERWEAPEGWWLRRTPLLVALFFVLLGFVFALLGLAGTLLDPLSDDRHVQSGLGGYLRSHALLVGAVALAVTVLIFGKIFTMRDKSGLTMSRLTTYVAALGIFDAACLAIAGF
jgi:ABC-type amino acid transport system permease subunit